MKAAIVGLILLALSFGAQASDLGQLAGQLDGLRANCSKQAMAAYMAHDTYQVTLDKQLADQQAMIDSRVYAVSHGSRETEENYLQQLQNNAQAADAKIQAIEAKFKSDGQAVQACTADAIEQGKQAYSSFKAAHRRSHGEADSLMAAWLANMGEIAAGAPQGGHATRDAWVQAKAHAELADL